MFPCFVKQCISNKTPISYNKTPCTAAEIGLHWHCRKWDASNDPSDQTNLPAPKLSKGMELFKDKPSSNSKPLFFFTFCTPFLKCCLSNWCQKGHNGYCYQKLSLLKRKKKKSKQDIIHENRNNLNLAFWTVQIIWINLIMPTVQCLWLTYQGILIMMTLFQK